MLNPSATDTRRPEKEEDRSRRQHEPEAGAEERGRKQCEEKMGQRKHEGRGKEKAQWQVGQGWAFRKVVWSQPMRKRLPRRRTWPRGRMRRCHALEMRCCQQGFDQRTTPRQRDEGGYDGGWGEEEWEERDGEGW